eukprot:CAMPEP_0201558128 /NCGR_PEP_ID=MMETSP0173_2-20130828/65985_1 /ASSEMBLY_ACC=CAM_ASM_000268 /TAXON_ID=218659 /ORGANISM="Vexillifera sp., Strain DIVA3 564/2" /LENGTH=195 /DNA_ID=CAMNT_0047971353 /DNA_START=88 /DNA_END=671 /DNA_ORIENTATION=+
MSIFWPKSDEHQQDQQGGGGFFSFLSESAGKLKEALVDDFLEESEKYTNETTTNQHSSQMNNLKPWELPLHRKYLEKPLKKQIDLLSNEQWNFLEPPPIKESLIDFIFDWNSFIPIAKECLERDPNLAQMRFKLVPSRVKEATFWENYAAHVHVLRKAILDNEKALEQQEKEQWEQYKSKKIENDSSSTHIQSFS